MGQGTLDNPDTRTRAPERKRILFVDDDQFLLDGLRDALWPYRDRWAMSFVADGERALEAVTGDSHHVVVSDLRMPGVDGANLLELVRVRCPTAVRIVLSGHADVGMVGRAAMAAHRLIAKPCATSELVRVIERSCALQDVAGRVDVYRQSIGAPALPSIPHVCAELMGLLGSGTAGAAEVGMVVEKDVGMAAKVLQLANSAYFGRRSAVSNVADAVVYLGLDAVRALALHAAVSQEFAAASAVEALDIDEFHRHCTRVAQLAAVLASETGAGRDAFTAGLLHDVGLLVMASSDDDGSLAQTLAVARDEGRPLHQVESEHYGVTHAEVGAHLLALWGLPHAVVESVAGQDRQSWLEVPFDLVAVVQIANALVEEAEATSSGSPTPDAQATFEYLERVGLGDRLPRWRERAQRDQVGGD
jgi:HD-like signal output (HDOD) protein/ActR/RegA family two-component response regulator